MVTYVVIGSVNVFNLYLCNYITYIDISYVHILHFHLSNSVPETMFVHLWWWWWWCWCLVIFGLIHVDLMPLVVWMQPSRAIGIVVNMSFLKIGNELTMQLLMFIEKERFILCQTLCTWNDYLLCLVRMKLRDCLC